MIIVNVPVEHGFGKTKGCKDAPCKIMQQLSRTGKKYKTEEWDLENKNLEETQSIIFKEALELFEKNRDSKEKIIFLGGDHSISFPLVRAFRMVYPLSFLFVLDAHVDLMEPMKEPSHEEWLRALIEGGFSPEEIILLGTRKIYDEEKDFLKRKKLKMIKKDEILDFFDSKKFMELEEYDAVYLSLDVDILDEEVMKATGYPEKEGMNLDALKSILERIFSLKNLKAMDIVEMNPEKDLNNKSLEIIIDIVKEMLKRGD